MFDDFFETVDTIEAGKGFRLFSPLHIAELVFALAFILLLNHFYKKSSQGKRKEIRKYLVIALIIDELIKHVGLLYCGRWDVGYLPLHLCSINIFLIIYHYFTNNKLVGNFLWAIATFAAAAALLTPNWSPLPFFNLMHLHSYTIHILLLAYPLIVTINHDIKKDYRMIGKLLVMLAFMALLVWGINLLLDTNFMFLMFPVKNTALVLVKQIFGNYQLGLFVVCVVVVLIMYIPYKVEK